MSDSCSVLLGDDSETGAHECEGPNMNKLSNSSNRLSSNEDIPLLADDHFTDVSLSSSDGESFDSTPELESHLRAVRELL